MDAVDFACMSCNKPLALPDPVDCENISPNDQAEHPGALDASVVQNEHRKPATHTKDSQNILKKRPPSNGVALNGKHGSLASGSASENSHMKLAPPDAAVPVDRQSATANGDSTATFAQHLRTTEVLNDIIAGGEPPAAMCCHCTDQLLELTDDKIKEEESLINEYKAYAPDDEEGETIEQLQAELAKVLAEEERLEALMAATKKEREKVFRQREAGFKALKRLEKLYEEETKECLLKEQEREKAHEEIASLQNQLDYAEEQRKLLEEVTAVERKFPIDCTERVATINGLALGRVDDAEGRNETNLAWGEAVHLLNVLAKKFDLQFENYTLWPSGDRSYIKLSDNPSIRLPLYLKKKTNTASIDAFDRAQVAFLDCISQLELKIQSGDSTFELFNPISDDTMYCRNSGNSYSIKKRGNSKNSWTRALKCMLENLKQIRRFHVQSIRDHVKDQLEPLEEYYE